VVDCKCLGKYVKLELANMHPTLLRPLRNGWFDNIGGFEIVLLLVTFYQSGAPSSTPSAETNNGPATENRTSCANLVPTGGLQRELKTLLQTSLSHSKIRLALHCSFASVEVLRTDRAGIFLGTGLSILWQSALCQVNVCNFLHQILIQRVSKVGCR
jgi:hypothetical protein